MTGRKFDENKPRLDLLPPHAIMLLGAVMTRGAAKYGDHNYLGGMDHGRLIGAALRHIFQYLQGKDIDELGTPHLANAAISLMMVLEYQERGIGKDDRFKKSDSIVSDDNAVRGELVRVLRGPERRVGSAESSLRIQELETDASGCSSEVSGADSHDCKCKRRNSSGIYGDGGSENIPRTWQELRDAFDKGIVYVKED